MGITNLFANIYRPRDLIAYLFVVPRPLPTFLALPGMRFTKIAPYQAQRGK